jgi:hypothetical protein
MLADISEERAFSSFRVEKGKEGSKFFRNVRQLLVCSTVSDTGKQQTS